MLKKNKSDKKKSTATALLLIYTIFLFQQISYSQVFCHKTDGSVELEPTYSGFLCECREKNNNPNNPDKFINKVIFAGEVGCFDVPFTNDLILREAHYNIAKLKFIEWDNIFDWIQVLLTASAGFSARQFPVSKFLYLSLFSYETAILRC